MWQRILQWEVRLRRFQEGVAPPGVRDLPGARLWWPLLFGLATGFGTTLLVQVIYEGLTH